jgi:hypothetical protein
LRRPPWFYASVVQGVVCMWHSYLSSRLQSAAYVGLRRIDGQASTRPTYGGSDMQPAVLNPQPHTSVTSHEREKGECRGAKPLCRGPRGVPLISCDLSRAGGWEEKRPCYGRHADAAPHAQRPLRSQPIDRRQNRRGAPKRTPPTVSPAPAARSSPAGLRTGQAPPLSPRSPHRSPDCPAPGPSSPAPAGRRRPASS